MARVIGYVKSLENGTFFIKDAKGHIHKLKAGEAIHDGELVYGAPNNPNNAKIIIDVTLQGAGDLVIAGNGALQFDTSLLEGVFSHHDAVVYVNSMKEALAVSDNVKPGSEIPNTDKNETAAGETLTDTQRPSNDVFTDRSALVKDVSTLLESTVTPTISDVQTQTDPFRPVILNSAPIAANAEITVIEDDQEFTGVLPIASDENGDPVTYALAVQAENGTVIINPDGSYTYVPNENYNGSDSFSYSVADGNGGTNTYTVLVSVTAVNDAPTAQNTEINVDEDGLFEGTLPLATDIDGDTVTYALAAQAENGTVIINPDGSYTYVPNENYNGSDSFSYSVADGKGGTKKYAVLVSVTPVNDTPESQAAVNEVDEDATGNVAATDADAGETSTLSYALVNAAPTGLTFNTDGSYSFDASS
ncbi:MAG: tandem-95 repeat protein, partial [Sulfuricurvum sp.]|nr:tandem-95 repeat protein [Sulfuricurvum sp.]